jgi:transposase
MATQENRHQDLFFIITDKMPIHSLHREKPSSRYGTTEEKLEVINLRAQGLSFDEIAKRTRFSKSGAFRIDKIWQEEKRIESMKRSGRPSKLSEHKRSQLVNLVEEHPDYTLQQISDASEIDVSLQTVGNTLRNEGFFSFVAEKEEEMKPPHKSNRVGWCKEREGWKHEWRIKVCRMLSCTILMKIINKFY